MDVRNCRNCNKLFNYIGGQQICPTCMKNLEDKFEEVREYIQDNPKATITEVSETNEVSVKQITRWIREERLSFSDDSIVGIQCEGCGAMIKTGRFCNKCKNSLQHDLGKAMKTDRPSPAKSEKESPRMRFLDR